MTSGQNGVCEGNLPCKLELYRSSYEMWSAFPVALSTSDNSIHPTEWTTDGRLIFKKHELHIAGFTDVRVPSPPR